MKTILPSSKFPLLVLYASLALAHENGLSSNRFDSAPPGTPLPSNSWRPFSQTMTQPMTILTPPSLAATVMSSTYDTLPTHSEISRISLDSNRNYFPLSSSARFSALSSASLASSSALPSPNPPQSLNQTLERFASPQMKAILALSIALGVILGGATAWIACGCIRRKNQRVDDTHTDLDNDKPIDGTIYHPRQTPKRKKRLWGGGRRRRESELEVGPEYTSLRHDEETDHLQPPNPGLTVPEKAFTPVTPPNQAIGWFQSVMTPSKNTVRESSLSPMFGRTQLSDFNHHKRSQSVNGPPSPTETSITSFFSHSSHDLSYLKPEKASKQDCPDTPCTNDILEVWMKEVSQMRIAGGFTPHIPASKESTSTWSTSPSNEHSPSQISRRQGHTRAHSDMVLDSVSPVYAPLARWEENDVSAPLTKDITNSCETPSNRQRTQLAKDFGIQGNSYLDVNSTPQTPSRSGSIQGQNGSLGKALAWASITLRGLEEADKYTPSPTRASGPKKLSRSKKQLQALGDPLETLIPSTIRRVLPQSPRLASAPLALESRLGFNDSPIRNINTDLAKDSEAIQNYSPDRPTFSTRKHYFSSRSPTARKLGNQQPPYPSFSSARPETSLDAAEIYDRRFTKNDPYSRNSESSSESAEVDYRLLERIRNR